MRTLTFASLLLILSAPAFAAAPKTTVLDLHNMTCPVCSITVRKALQKSPGVVGASVDYDHKTATVTYDPDRTDIAHLIQATTSAGFPSTPHPGASR